MQHLAIFASGSGSNARCILEHCARLPQVRVALIVTNRPDAGVLQHAATFQVPTCIIDRSYFYDSEALLGELHAHAVDFIALAGFLWLVPPYLTTAFPDRILNIHPALLPKYGGPGMYGKHVHRAVKAAGEYESGITIHLVNERYDEGRILFQAKTALAPTDDPTQIAQKVLALEHRHYPSVLTDYIARVTAAKISPT